MMKDFQTLLESMSHSIERPRSFEDILEGQYGTFVWEHIRDGKVINSTADPNGVTNNGKLYMLGTAFNGLTQDSSWNLGLIDGSSSSPVLNSTDIMGSHSGWNEFVTYNETVRQAWVKGTASGNMVAGTTSATYTIGTVAPNVFVAGGFVCSDATKGGTTGVLWSTGLFTNAVPVQATDIFRLGYLTGL